MGVYMYSSRKYNDKRITVPDFKPHYRDLVTKQLTYWHKTVCLLACLPCLPVYLCAFTPLCLSV